MQILNRLKKYIFKAGVLALGVTAVSCTLQEDPPLANKDEIYDGVEGEKSVLVGIYSKLIDFGGYKTAYHQSKQMHAGLFYSGRTTDLSQIVAFNPPASNTDITNDWSNHYNVINRCNVLIDDMDITLDSTFANDSTLLVQSLDIAGNAHFIRAFEYFNLVRAFGEVPLQIGTTKIESIHLPKSPRKEIFEQIIKDASLAAHLLSENGLEHGYPKKYAAEMLLSKVYMYLASAQRTQDPYNTFEGINEFGDATTLWNKAFTHASAVYGKYSLLPDYRSLFTIISGNQSTESIFELNFNASVVNPNYKVLYTPRNYTAGVNSWGRIMPNPEVYDAHEALHPGDPRIEATFLYEYKKFKSGGIENGTHKTYPVQANRVNKQNGFPFLKKFVFEDQSTTSLTSQKGFILYRYADLLLMLAEIENERGNLGEAVKYANEVLFRARNSADEFSESPADLVITTQDELRETLYYERQAELLGEGEDWFEVRRRGFEFFRQHVILPHNNFEFFNENLDVKFNDDPKAMFQPIPLVEINTNQYLTSEDQNLGY